MRKLPWHTDPRDSGSSFLPKDYVKGKQEVRFVAITVSLFVIVMLAVVGAFLVTNRRWATVRDQQRVISAQYESEKVKLEQLKTLEAQRDEMLSKARITTALLEAAPRSVLLAELVTSLPEEATLLQAKLVSKRVKQAPPAEAAKAASKAKSKSKSKSDGKGENEEPAKPPPVQPPKFEYTLTITGVAPTNNEVADYLTRLQQSPLLKSVELAFIEDTKLQDLQLRRFEIVAQLPEDADARQVEEAEEFELDMVSAVEKEDDQ
ncbi:MAG: PilN domain-containing protein [Phycisphaerales bacterium]|nr:PilN domain-containing protein [Phycisphaerales bacterium]